MTSGICAVDPLSSPRLLGLNGLIMVWIFVPLIPGYFLDRVSHSQAGKSAGVLESGLTMLKSPGVPNPGGFSFVTTPVSPTRHPSNRSNLSENICQKGHDWRAKVPRCPRAKSCAKSSWVDSGHSLTPPSSHFHHLVVIAELPAPGFPLARE